MNFIPRNDIYVAIETQLTALAATPWQAQPRASGARIAHNASKEHNVSMLFHNLVVKCSVDLDFGHGWRARHSGADSYKSACGLPAVVEKEAGDLKVNCDGKKYLMQQWPQCPPHLQK